MARLALLLLLGVSWLGSAQAARPSLPFVTCPTNGQSGPVPPPTAPPVMPPIPAAAAERLALYASDGMAVLAPRGWGCSEEYGSGGAVLLVAPRLDATVNLPDAGTLAGHAIEFSFLNGENSGRYMVAEVFARLFPFKRRFIRSVESDEDHPRHFPRGPYPTDRTVRHSRAEVDYATPPHRQGMGTYESRMRPGADPIAGKVTLAHANTVDSVVLLQVRLPPDQRALTPTIVRTAKMLLGDGR